MKKLTAILFIALAAILVTPLFVQEVNVGTLFIAFGALLVSSLAVPKRMLTMALQVEIWERDIVGNLFKNNDFAKVAFSADQYVYQGKVVHIPYAGTPSSTKKNRNSFPAAAVSRGDADVTYSIDTYSTDPRRIANIDKYELSYDKRQSVIAEDQAILIQTAMDGLLYSWAPAAANVVETVGDSASATLSGATGTRKAFTKAVFATIKVKMDRDNIPSLGRKVLLTADHHQQLMDSFSDVEKTNFHNTADLQNGIVGRYLGFDIMMRSTVLRYRKVSGVWTPVDEYADDYAATTADSAGSLFYYEQAVERALGGVTMFDNPNRAEYYGDIISFELRMGGRIRRSSGVWAVVEAATS